MAFVNIALAVGTTVGLSGTAAVIGGGALIGAGTGAAYSGLTGDGDILDSALIGAGIGGGAAYALPAMGVGGAETMAAYNGPFFGGAAGAAPGVFGSGAAPTAFTTPVPDPSVISTSFSGYTGGIPKDAFGSLSSSGYTGGMPQDAFGSLSSNAATTSAQAADMQYAAQDMMQQARNIGSVPGAPDAINTGGNSLMNGFNAATTFMKTYPIESGLGIMAAANMLGLNKPTTFDTPGVGNKMNTGYYKLDPATFKPTRQDPITNPVRPVYPDYVANPYQPGGITGYARGGSAHDERMKDYQEQVDMLNQYEQMTSGKSNRPRQEAPPSYIGNPGIYSDSDPNTRNKDAYSAAKTRMMLINARANMPAQRSIREVAPLGQINVNPLLAQQEQAQQPMQEAANGGIMGYALGGMPNQMYPQSMQDQTNFAQSSQYPTSAQQVNSYEPMTNPLTGDMNANSMAMGGITGYNLGGYASGNMPRLLRGPGDGVSDDIPATIGGKQEARLADGEFVVPARIVSELGNGSTEAGAKRLHQMMDRVQAMRSKSIGKGKVAVNSKAYKAIPKA